MFDSLKSLATDFKVDRILDKYDENVYSPEQLFEIELGVRSGIDVSKYDNPNNSPQYMCNARVVLQEGFNPDDYLNIRNMGNVQLGKWISHHRQGHDASILYDNIWYSADTDSREQYELSMISSLIYKGYDPSPIALKNYPIQLIHAIHDAVVGNESLGWVPYAEQIMNVRSGLDDSLLEKDMYGNYHDPYEALSRAYKNGLSPEPYVEYPTLRNDDYKVIYLMQRNNVDYHEYARKPMKEFESYCMFEIVAALIDGLSITDWLEWTPSAEEMLQDRVVKILRTPEIREKYPEMQMRILEDNINKGIMISTLDKKYKPYPSNMDWIWY